MKDQIKSNQITFIAILTIPNHTLNLTDINNIIMTEPPLFIRRPGSSPGCKHHMEHQHINNIITILLQKEQGTVWSGG